jgi:hypothetical protein
LRALTHHLGEAQFVFLASAEKVERVLAFCNASHCRKRWRRQRRGGGAQKEGERKKEKEEEEEGW